MKKYLEQTFAFNSGREETYLLPIDKEYNNKTDEELLTIFNENLIDVIFKPLFKASSNGQYNFIDKAGYYTIIKLSDVSRFSYKIVQMKE